MGKKRCSPRDVIIPRENTGKKKFFTGKRLFTADETD
jgi:hypothetical protein